MMATNMIVKMRDKHTIVLCLNLRSGVMGLNEVFTICFMVLNIYVFLHNPIKNPIADMTGIVTMLHESQCCVRLG